MVTWRFRPKKFGMDGPSLCTQLIVKFVSSWVYTPYIQLPKFFVYNTIYYNNYNKTSVDIVLYWHYSNKKNVRLINHYIGADGRGLAT